MNILTRLANLIRPQAQSRPSAWDDIWYEPPGLATASGAVITPDSAMRITAVMVCVRILAETLASIPLNVYRRLNNGGKERATDHPLWPLLHDQPNTWQTSFEWREMMMGHLALRGNGYSEIISDRAGRPLALEPIHPDRVECERLANGKIRYLVRVENNAFNKRTISQDNMFHIRTFSSDGLKGLSPIALHAEAIGYVKTADEYGARFFGDDARPGGAITHPETLSDTVRKNLRTSWIAQHAGSGKAHTPAIFEEGMGWEKIGVSPEEAQFLETRKYGKGDIASAIYRIPLHMVGLLDNATFTNIEHQSLEFVKYTMLPWFRRFETSADRDLVTEDDIFVEFLVDGLLRGDVQARSQSLQIQKQNGVLSANEWRIMENRNPVEGGDEYAVAANIAGKPGNSNDAAARAVVTETKATMSVIEDDAKRIAAAEIRELAKHVDRAEDDREKFNVWVESYFGGTHRRYTAIVLAPLITHRQRESGCLIGVGALEAAIIDNAVERWKVEPIADLWASWQKTRVVDIQMLIVQGIDNAIPKSN